MASERQITANRKNALKSTGPQSAGGKARAARNAFKHGLASSGARDADASQAGDRLTRALVAERDDRSAMAAIAASAAAAALMRARSVRTKASAELQNSFKKRYAEGSIVRALAELQRMDRYVRRAMSRKKRAFRELSGSF